jgi:NADH dehydrogenase
MGEERKLSRHQVVVIGSGFGGLFGTKALRRADVDVTVIARTGHHLFQPLLYQVATGILSEGEIAPSTREVLARQRNARVLLGEVTAIDLASRTVTSEVLGRPTVTPYDSLIVAAGSGQSYFGNDRFAEYAPGMKSIDDALELRGRIFGAFELAELGASRGEDVDALLTFVVVGAGPTGVEMAGQIAELAHRTLGRDFRAINTRKARILLVEAAGQVLPPFGAVLGAKTKVQLEKLGVEVRLGAMVTDVGERGLVVQDKDGHSEWIAAATKIWAAGVQASSLTKTLSDQTGAPVDRAGRIGVNPDLTLPGYPEVFVVGDMIALDHLPGVAQVAIQGSKYAAKEIQRRLAGKPPQKPFHYFDKGDLATISRFRAVARIGRFRLTGFVAWLLWLGVHIVYLTGFKNRITALGHWAVSFIGRGRSERTATEQQIFGRQALTRLEGGAAGLVSGNDVPGPDPAIAARRRQELEEQALAEMQLTDSGERGRPPG